MPETPTPLLSDDEQTRDRLRALLTVCCVLAVLLAGTVVPAMSGSGLGETPLGSVVPQPSVDPFSQRAAGAGGASGAGGVGGAGGLGALNPGEKTDVGGPLADDQNAFRSQNAEVHFTVRSSVASYWRTGAYDTYTGSGWEQSGDRQPYTEPIAGDGIRGKRVEYRVALEQSATALPTVWRANAVSRTDSVFVTDQGAFESDDPLPAGTTYSGVSHLPVRDPTVLRAAGRDYPADVERRYTALPASTDGRVADFASRLTEDANSPYESAKRIETWLEANKNYSLNASRPEGDVAEEFIFEMEEGYCEYFATSMTVMLRSQGIPARYVVGYSTGQRIGENAYKVRAMNAHAWVEVYFPDVGWVKFDPTPGRSRLEAEQQSFQNQTDSGSYEPTERGSPDEQFSPNASTESTGSASGGESGTVSESERGTAEGSGTIEGSDTAEGGTRTSDGSGTADGTASATTAATDGTATGDETTETGDRTNRETTTTESDSSDDADGSEGSDPEESRSDGGYDVELNRTPVPGATVAVTVRRNGTPATDVPVAFNGEPVGRTDEAGTVTAQVPYARTLRIAVGGEVAKGSAALSSPPPTRDASFALASGPPRAIAPQEEPNETEYPLETNATLTISGDVVTASEVVVTATVEDVPVRNAEVRLGGERVGTTDESGRVRLTLPDSPGNVTVSVSRGSVSGTETVFLPRLNATVEPTLPLALPGTGVEVRATYGNDTVSGARVRVGDARHETDVNGTATATLPFRANAAVVVSAHGQTRRTTVPGLFRNLLGALAGAAAVLGGLLYGAYRLGYGPRRLLRLLLGLPRAVPGLVVAVLFGAADYLERAVRAVLAALRDLRAGETTVRELVERLRAWLAERGRAVRAHASLEPLSASTSPGESPTESETDDSYRTLREAWRSFLEAVSVRRLGGMTPADLADHAVREDDLPADAVATLRDAFRDVEYGARSPGDRLARVEAAIDAIERTTRETDAETGREAADADPSGGEA